MKEWAKGRCLVPDCRERSASRLGVCADHWRALPADHRRRWQEAWHAYAGVKAWTAMRRECVEYLSAGRG